MIPGEFPFIRGFPSSLITITLSAITSHMPEEPNLDARELLLQQILGKAKEQFSQPSLNNDESGDLAFAIAADPENQVVRLRFGKPVTWLAFEPALAREFCELILKKVSELEQGTQPPLESGDEQP